MRGNRYADDFVVLISGNLNESKHVKLNIKEFLKTHCGAALNDEKTTITNIMDNKFEFLGADIRKSKRSNFTMNRLNSKMKINPRLLINAPIYKLVQRLIEAGFIRRDKLGKIWPLSYNKIINLTHYEIIKFYNSKINGILNYYSFASNRPKLQRILYYLQLSCAYTLATKYKSSAPKMFKLFGKTLKDPETDITLTGIYKPLKVIHYFSNSPLKDPLETLNITWSNKLTQSTFNQVCKLCGSITNLESGLRPNPLPPKGGRGSHHLRKVKDIRHIMRTGNLTYEKWIGATNRKQVALCQYHHKLLHKGQLTASELRKLYS